MRYQDAVSKWRQNKLGVPQGTISSPGLWNFYTSCTNNNSFADNFHNIAVSSDVDTISESLGAQEDGGMGEQVGHVYLDAQIICNPIHAMDQAGQQA